MKIRRFESGEVNDASQRKQAADAEDELQKLKARLDAVVKECENQMPEQMFIRMKDEASLQVKESVTAILRVARGESETENK